ncbi:Folylpolyglutamate synthetase, partial [Trapelia coarctata]|nr:Folylpolyglutamate synthetase [Trapelia coarctata]
HPAKVGLYTSPHLKDVRERIQINSEPISEDSFARYFFKTWEKIAPGDTLDPDNRPGYFRFLTLMSFDIFLEEEVTVAIYETGVGGENDATNVIETPVATGITGLGLDHQRTLTVAPHLRPSYFQLEPRVDQEDGATIEEIAYHKAGIFKNGCPAFSVPQQYNAANVLRHRAEEKGVSLTFVDSNPQLCSIEFPSSVHRENAALAVVLANCFLHKHDETRLVDYSRISEEAIRGLHQVRLLGRCQLLKEGPIEWYLDGAHTEDSLVVAGQWYAKTTNSTSPSLPHILIFNHQSQRDGDALLRSLFNSLQINNIRMQHAIFSTNTLHNNGVERADFVNHNRNPAMKALQDQHHYGALWQSFDPDCHIKIAPTVEEAVELAREVGMQGMQTLITGSFHLVGAALCVLDPDIST